MAAVTNADVMSEITGDTKSNGGAFVHYRPLKSAVSVTKTVNRDTTEVNTTDVYNELDDRLDDKSYYVT